MLPSGPSGETAAASTGHGNTPRRQPRKIATHSPIQPNPWHQPRISLAWSPRPPTHTTTSAVKIVSSAAEYSRTAWKYDIPLEAIPGPRRLECARLLRAHERLVGGRKKVSGRLAAVRVELRDPGRQPQRHPGRPRGARDRRPDALRNLLGAVPVGLGQDDGELVTAPPVRDVRPPQRGTQRLRDALKHAVALEVAEAIVEVLELVDVADEHAQRIPGHARAIHRLRQRFVEGAPVEQSGERVDARLTAGALALLAEA